MLEPRIVAARIHTPAFVPPPGKLDMRALAPSLARQVVEDYGSLGISPVVPDPFVLIEVFGIHLGQIDREAFESSPPPTEEEPVEMTMAR